MKKTFLFVLVLILLVAAGYYFFSQQDDSAVLGLKTSPTQSVTSVPPPDDLTGQVEALGRLVPAQYGDLYFLTNGIIQNVTVTEGQQVQEGDILAELRDEQQMKLAVSQARLEVLNAERALSDLEQNAPLQAAQAYYEMTIAEKEIDRLEKRRTSMDYPRAPQEDIDDAYEAYTSAQDAFEQASEYFKPDDGVYKAAKNQRDSALSYYNWLISKYTDLEKQETEANLILQQQRRAEQERLYNMYSKGPNPQDISIAQARLEVAKEQLAAAEASFEDLILRAPFAGTVVRLDFTKGQFITANQPLLVLADLSRWNVETEDLTEISVIQIQEGDVAEIAIDALPESSFQGEVKEIKKIGVTNRGDITYTVVIGLADNDPRLRWNMTTTAIITAE